MIVPMKKYSFLVYHREYDQFLNDLQDLGLVHVIEKESGEIENEELRAQHTQISELTDAINFLSKRNIPESTDLSDKDVSAVIDELKNVRRTYDSNQGLLDVLKKEHKALSPWGEFNWTSIEKLSEAGLNLKLLSCSSRVFENSGWGDTYFIEEISRTENNVNFALFYRDDEKIEIDAEEASLPTKSLSEISKLIDEAHAILSKSEKLFDTIASNYITLLSEYRAGLQGKLSFEKVKLNTHAEADNKLMVLEGWSPKDKTEALDAYLDKSGVYYESMNPNIEEAAPPVKLKNNKFAKLYESIGELYTFPNYGEIDLTPFFAPFYMLFFGFCLGDAGYGLLITIATIIGIFKVEKKYKPLLKLGMYLGIATTFMGIVSGTFFGIFLLKVDWEWIQQYQKFMLGDDSMMALALGLGYIQILFAMFIKAANKARMYGFKYSISQLGWNLIVMVAVPAFALGYTEVIPVDTANSIALIALIIGGIPALFYNTPGKNPLLNLGTGIWDSYQMVSGLLGDVLSYIRLFALGISSAILGNVFNTLAMDLSPDIIVVKQLVMVLILAFGHGLNFFMAALGSFVHPLRLTFVEFYKNAGFMGGGKKYEPFRK